jgi:hypothetical protein
VEQPTSINTVSPDSKAVVIDRFEVMGESIVITRLNDVLYVNGSAVQGLKKKTKTDQEVVVTDANLTKKEVQ